MKFIVAAPDYSEAHGGIMVLHYLAHLLATQGFETSIACKSTFPHSEASVLDWVIGTPFNHAIDDQTMAIYPEIISDNPFKARKVTRWILYKEGERSSPIQYGLDDFIFQYGPFHTPLNRKSHGLLHIRMINAEILQNRQNKRDIPFAHIVRKGYLKNPYAFKSRRHPPRSKFLDEECRRGIQHMSYLFNRVRLVVSYDSESLCAYAAALCGCVVVIIPTKGISKLQFWNDFPSLKSGIAYGWLDLPRAMLTRNRVREELEKIEQENLESVAKFLDLIQ